MKDGRRYNNCCPFHHISIQKARLAGKRKKTFGSLTEKKTFESLAKKTFASLAEKTFGSLAEKHLDHRLKKHLDHRLKKTFVSLAEKNIQLLNGQK